MSRVWARAGRRGERAKVWRSEGGKAEPLFRVGEERRALPWKGVLVGFVVWWLWW
jgi:hypothetical protein